MHFFNGRYPGKLPMVLGHESAGIVEQVGSDVERSILLGGRSDPERGRGRLRSTGEFGDGRRGVDHETPA